MSTMKTSGIVGVIAVIVGLIGFTMSWMDLYLFGIKLGSFSGFDLIDGMNDPMLILILLIGGLLVSGISFTKCTTALRIAFVILGIGVIACSISVMKDMTFVEGVFGLNGTTPGAGLFFEVVAGVILMGAAACRRTRDPVVPMS